MPTRLARWLLNPGTSDLASPSHLPSTREDALAAWKAFLPGVAAYAEGRNHVQPGHANVSRLSVALRHRLITEDEVIRDTLDRFGFRAAEKWLQEVCWRRYWKGWLELRPSVWSSWRQRVRELRESLPGAVLERAAAVAAGESGVACMDVWARELIETGYLHNHVRMWWASFWIHVERLPWELGADFFYRHLLDADPASNTLSWRWVAGLQTPGKTYLVRWSNLEKYAHPAVLQDRRGSERIADGRVVPVVSREFADTSKRPLPVLPTSLGSSPGRAGLWLHTDDLAPELGPLTRLAPVAIGAFTWERSHRGEERLSEGRIRSLRGVLADGVKRAATHYPCPAALTDGDDVPGSMVTWAEAHGLSEVVALAPTVGPVADLVPQISKQLAERGVRLQLVRRPSDAHVFGLAQAGFFPFWEKLSRQLSSPESMACSSGSDHDGSESLKRSAGAVACTQCLP